MAFKNEVVSDDDIDRYQLPFTKGEGRWWTRDAERDYYLWGGLSGNRAFDDTREGRFYLYVDETLYFFLLCPGSNSKSLKENPYIVQWKSILYAEPEISEANSFRTIVGILKEALLVFGLHGENTLWPVRTTVLFDF
jgi:hypothetical protein